MRNMNCDQVFEVLTRGPFPTGTDCDEPVEAHLNHCPECRRLADALRPALELFQEAVDPEESRDLPGYWSGVATDGTRAAVSYAAEIEPRPAAARGRARHTLTQLSGRWSASTAWRMAAMLLLGVTLGALARGRMAIDGFAWGPFGVSQPAPASPQDDAPHGSLAERMQWTDLSTACFRDELEPDLHGDQLLASADLAGLSCCSGCHNGASDVASGSATAKVAQSCQLCHNERPTQQLGVGR